MKNQRAVRNVTQPIRFQGQGQWQWHDEESGLYYNRHRYYDPQQGRYISQDPIGLKGGGNLYVYVGNPTGMMDPLGLEGVIQCAQNGQGTADRVAREVTARGNFKGKYEADWIYQNNSNPNLSVTVDASQLTVETGEHILMAMLARVLQGILLEMTMLFMGKEISDIGRMVLTRFTISDMTMSCILTFPQET